MAFVPPSSTFRLAALGPRRFRALRDRAPVWRTVGSSLVGLDASSATHVQAGPVGSSGSRRSVQGRLSWAFVPFGASGRRVHRHRLCHRPAVAPLVPFPRLQRLAPRSTVPGFSPGNAHGVLTWSSRAFPRTGRPPSPAACPLLTSALRTLRTSLSAPCVPLVSRGSIPASGPSPPARRPGARSLLDLALLQGLTVFTATL